MIGSRGIVSQVPYGYLSPISAGPSFEGDPLVFPDVPLLLASIILIESIDCAFSLGNCFLTFLLGCGVTRFNRLLLFFAPLPGFSYEYSLTSNGPRIIILDHFWFVLFQLGIKDGGCSGGWRLGTRGERWSTAKCGLLLQYRRRRLKSTISANWAIKR